VKSVVPGRSLIAVAPRPSNSSSPRITAGLMQVDVKVRETNGRLVQA
jgi:hypothetical protein